MSTEDFQNTEQTSVKNLLSIEGHTIVGFDESPFRDFNVPGDQGFLEIL
jgi:hypothetical protein